MSYELAAVLGLLLTAVVLFVVNKPRMDMVALIMLAALPFTGVVNVHETLAGFSEPNIVLIAALFVLGDGLVRTGVARQLGDWLISKAGNNETRLMVLLMVVVCMLGATMSSTAVTAIFIPVALRISQRTGTAPSRLMMPLSMAALMSGMMTLVATAPNLVVNSELQRQGVPGFGFFSFTPFGVPILIVGICYMLFARRWLAHGEEKKLAAKKRPSLSDWIELYRLAHREYRLRITAKSSLVGKRIEELDMNEFAGMTIVAIERRQRFAVEILQTTPKRELLADDILLIDFFVPDIDLDLVLHKFGLERMPLKEAYFNDHSQEIGMAEVIVPEDSELVGHTIMENRFRTRTGLTVIGLRRGNTALEENVLEENLKVGDTLLVIGPWRDIQRVHPDESGVLVLRMPIEVDEVLPVSGRMLPALGCLALVVGLMVSGLIPNVQAALIGCLLMGAFGCITPTSAYRAIDWKTLVLIVGMFPFSLALERTGGVELAASGLKAMTSEAGPSAVMAILFVITAVLGMFISNTATAILVAPVAIALAGELGASPYPFAMIVALAASTAFMTPVSSPVNTLVVSPGNYTFFDFVKIGVPFSLIVMTICVFLVPWLLPLY